MLFHIKAAIAVLIGQIDHVLQHRRRHRQIVQAALKFLLHILIHAANPDIQLPVRQMQRIYRRRIETIAQTRRKGKSINAAVEDIKTRLRIVGV